jgi:geranylgeranyl diphosphate synthase, type I
MPSPDLALALRIIEYKTARYTVERPLQLGVMLAGGGPDQLAACTAYARPLGEAFQLRDDLLGVFADPATTGKPNLDDLRDGKHTALIALALQRASAGQARQIHTLLGDPGLGDRQAEILRGVLIDTGAVATVQEMIERRQQEAIRELSSAPFPPHCRSLLASFTATLASRSS